MCNLNRIIILFLLTIIITGCSETASDKSGSAAVNPSEYYLLNSFPVNKTSIPENPGELLPWTEQVRVADFTAAGDSLYLAVNNTGIMKIDLDNPSIDNMKLFQSDNYISGNAMKSIFYFDDSVFCHVYRDSFFSENISGSSVSPLIRLNSSDDSIFPEFRRTSVFENKEAVDFIYTGKNWISSWKYSDKDSSSFNYFSHDISGNDLSEISEAEYRKELENFDNADTEDLPFRKIINFVHDKSGASYITDLSLKFLNCTTTEKYRSIKSSEEMGTYSDIHVYRSGSTYWFSAGNNIYNLDSEGAIIKLLIDPLPSGYEYTGICFEKGKLYLFWEYQSFFNTGKSGFSIIDEKRVDKITI